MFGQAGGFPWSVCFTHRTSTKRSLNLGSSPSGRSTSFDHHDTWSSMQKTKYKINLWLVFVCRGVSLVVLTIRINPNMNKYNDPIWLKDWSPVYETDPWGDVIHTFRSWLVSTESFEPSTNHPSRNQSGVSWDRSGVQSIELSVLFSMIPKLLGSTGTTWMIWRIDQ